MADRDDDEDIGTPRWVKRSAIAGGVLVVALAVAALTGHGPRQHGQPPSAATPVNQP